MKKNILKKLSVTVMAAAMIASMTACNSKIKVDYGYNPTDYVKLGEYKGITVSVDETSIENELIEKKIKNDLNEKITYSEVDREAKEADKVTVDMSATIGGTENSGFSDEDHEFVLGTDTFEIEGFVDALYGMTTGQTKIVQLTVPENFTQAEELAGRKIVYEITMKKVEQPNIPMITDAYVKENFSYDTVADYRAAIKTEIQSTIDEKITASKKEAVLTKLQDNCSITGYPQDVLDAKSQELNKSISFYSMMQDLSVDEYCKKNFNLSFDDYVKKALAQDMIFQAIAQNEKYEITEYEYKGDLEDFANKMGSTDKDSFVEKYGKDKIVRAMLLQKAEDVVMNNAIYQ